MTESKYKVLGRLLFIAKYLSYITGAYRLFSLKNFYLNVFIGLCIDSIFYLFPISILQSQNKDDDLEVKEFNLVTKVLLIVEILIELYIVYAV